MFGYQEVNLKDERGRNFFYHKRKINSLMQELENLRKKMSQEEQTGIPWEIKRNNDIEGFHDNIGKIKEAILRGNQSQNPERNRIWNLYQGYCYILENPPLNEENLHILYTKISDGLLDDYSRKHMGEFYRNGEVYIINNRGFVPDFDKGVPKEKVKSSMSDLLEYANEAVDTKEVFIRSQIIHFYFVYVHPYFDGNGRCARMVSLWYLLKENSSSYQIFNRRIFADKEDYKKSIRKSRSGNLTAFLEFIIKETIKELEKEFLLQKIQEKERENLSKEEYGFLIFLQETRNQTVKEIEFLYQEAYSDEEYSKERIMEIILSLVEKNIIEIKENQTLKIREDFIKGQEEKQRQYRKHHFK